jgi:hydroxyacylglutathione hydrolase
MNSYLLNYKGNCIVIDPGFNGEEILTYIESHGLTLTDVFITHGHYDHIRDLRLLTKKIPFKVYIHELDKPMLYDDKLNYAVFFNGSFRLKQEQRVIIMNEGDEIAFGMSPFKVWHTPGHTVGSVCLEYQNMVFTGDTLFHGDLGRTDLIGGSQKMLDQSIIKLFRVLPNDLSVYPGHEEPTTIGQERKENTYVLRLLK